MTPRQDIAAIQHCISNSSDLSAIGDRQIAGIIGDAPSAYSKSPALWNAAFESIGIHATYVPFDVDAKRLGDLLSALKRSERFIGVNVTVPHKIKVMEFLDDIDAGAKRLQAVNTIVRTAAGRLIGYNTDGQGFIESLLAPQPGHAQPFMPSLQGTNVVLLGAGGSARAVAFHLSDRLGNGELFICNRTSEHSISLATELQNQGRKARAIDEEDLKTWTDRIGLIVNSSTKGQGGVRKLADGRLIDLEPYSALAPAHPPPISPSEFNEPRARQIWRQAAQPDVDANHQASLRLAQLISQDVHFYDLIYHPAETVFLRHGRMTGHRTQNGKAMIICQAVIAFCQHICKQHLVESGRDNADTYREVGNVMFTHW